MNTNITAGVTVHINSNNVPCTMCLCDILLFAFEKFTNIDINIHDTNTTINVK